MKSQQCEKNRSSAHRHKGKYINNANNHTFTIEVSALYRSFIPCENPAADNVADQLIHKSVCPEQVMIRDSSGATSSYRRSRIVLCCRLRYTVIVIAIIKSETAASAMAVVKYG